MIRLAALLLGTAAAAQPVPDSTARYGAPGAASQLFIQGTTDIENFGPLLEAFAATVPELGITYEEWGSNILASLAAAACRGETPSADVVLNSAVDLQVELVNAGCAQPHRSVLTADLPPEVVWRDEIFGVTSEPAVIVYNRDLVPPAEVPRSRFDLIDLLRPADSRYAGRVATYDIEASGVGYLFAFADSQEATTFGGLIEAFGRSGAVATCCSAEIIDGVAEGTYLLAYNVLGSYALDRAAADPRIGIVPPEDYTLVLSRAAMIPKGAANPAAAGLFIDFMFSEPGRAALAAKRLLPPPVDPDAVAIPDLPEQDASFYRPIPLSPVLLLGLDRQKRAQFLALWRATFPRR